jgi:hypothetical protein
VGSLSRSKVESWPTSCQKTYALNMTGSFTMAMYQLDKNINNIL